MAKEQKSNYCEYCGDFHDPFREYQSSVRVGETVPDYEFESFYKNDTQTMKFSDFRGKWLIVMFYPADFTFVCPTELEEMALLYPKLQKINADVVSFSTDTVFVHKAWHDTSEAIKKIEFPMGADPSGKIADAFGVLVEGGDLPFVPDEGLALRGTFIIDPSGTLRSMEINDNSIGRSARETYRKLQAAQFVESNHGQVCPASWEPGDDTLEPGMDLVGKI
ncbi:redoxin domain-containing protein [Patescibacteria group bacterium]|nr:redoxin domain-containing protein [Patescibacteria group bacterium]MBU2158646.1 redoxin domain-containing protein [Patescibacteria group bacterium]MBU2220914.1 redoxin domain-containing protein [Patescibacteria group bacterium]